MTVADPTRSELPAQSLSQQTHLASRTGTE